VSQLKLVALIVHDDDAASRFFVDVRQSELVDQYGVLTLLVSHYAGLAATHQWSQSIFKELEHDSRVSAQHDTHPVFG
jgi:hypothetical protein